MPFNITLPLISSSNSDMPLNESGGDSIGVKKRIPPVLDGAAAVDAAAVLLDTAEPVLFVDDGPVNTICVLSGPDDTVAIAAFDLDRRKMMENLFTRGEMRNIHNLSFKRQIGVYVLRLFQILPKK